MEHLFIHDKVTEYYTGNIPVIYFDGIKQINLFIGANNTRKSRFMRDIFQLEPKFLWECPEPLNEVIQKIPAITEIVKTAFPDRDPVVMKFKRILSMPEPDERFALVSEYFNTSYGQDHKVTMQRLAQQVKLVSEAVLITKNEANFQSLQQSSRIIYDMLDYLIYIYEKLAEGIEQPVSEPNAMCIEYTLPDREPSGGAMQDTGEKIHCFRQLAALIRPLRFLTLEIVRNLSYYIPVLRTSRTLISNASIAGNIFEQTIKQQYFGDNLSVKCHIETGQENYNLIRNGKNGKYTDRQNFTEFEHFIGENFFQSKDIVIVAYVGGGIMVSLPGENHDIPIQNLGDGVQAIINLFLPIYMAQQDSWIFIDEPELNLHPGFQNLFIRTLLENEYLQKKNLRYFINTHSNHLLSEILIGGSKKAEVFVFSKRDKDSSNIHAFKGFETNTLDLLGVMNASTLISNCSVWVEGITDRLYLRAFLTAYAREQTTPLPIEGLAYTFIEYGGKNLVHYLFEETNDENKNSQINPFFINSKIFLLADTDTKKEKQHAKLTTAQRKNFIYEQTKVAEIENLLPKNVLAKFLQDELNIEFTIAINLFDDEHAATKLGAYLAPKLEKLNLNRKIADPSGTLNPYYKMKLAEYIIAETNVGSITWQMLKESNHLRIITEKLFKFITANNTTTSEDI